MRRLAIATTIVAGSQLGHALAYLVRFGSAAGERQAAGVHAYFPGLIGAVSAGIGGALMACLVLVAAARLLRGARPGHRSRRAVGFLDLLPALFVCQLLVFMGQETIESFAGGGPVPSVVEQLLWGSLGQLPAACAAAAVLSWLSARTEAAWDVLLAAVARLAPEPFLAIPMRGQRLDAAPVRALTSAFPSAFRKRGPPRRLPRPVS